MSMCKGFNSRVVVIPFQNRTLHNISVRFTSLSAAIETKEQAGGRKKQAETFLSFFIFLMACQQRLSSDIILIYATVKKPLKIITIKIITGEKTHQDLLFPLDSARSLDAADYVSCCDEKLNSSLSALVAESSNCK